MLIHAALLKNLIVSKHAARIDAVINGRPCVILAQGDMLKDFKATIGRDHAAMLASFKALGIETDAQTRVLFNVRMDVEEIAPNMYVANSWHYSTVNFGSRCVRARVPALVREEVAA